MKTITPSLAGGLGNQMFFIASSYGIAHRHGDRELVLSSKLFRGCGQGNHPTKYFDTVYRNIKKTNEEPKTDCVLGKSGWSGGIENYFEFADKMRDCEQIILEHSFFEVASFEFCEDEVKNLFTLEPSSLLEKYPDVKDSIVIHVRRGDYAKHPTLIVLPTTYYRNALNAIPDQENLKKYIVTDISEEEIANDFSFMDYTLIRGNDEVEEMSFMTNGEYFIGSNGTFAWWSAYLGEYGKKSYFPDKWHDNDCGWICEAPYSYIPIE